MAYTRDATSGWVIPQSAAEWTSLLTGSGLSNPAHLWLCQESSGNLADTIGADTLTAFGSPSYQQSVTGWTTKGVKASGGDDFYGTGVDLSSTSGLLLVYAKINNTPGVDGQLCSIGHFGDSQRRIKVSTTPRFEAEGDGGQATGTGTIAPGSDAHPLLLRVNLAAGYYKLTTDKETIFPAYTAPSGAGSSIDIGSNGQGALDATIMYAALFTGSAAEMSDADVLLLLDLLAPPASNSPPRWGSFSGVGSPQGALAAPVGTIYRNLAGGAGTTLWVKELGTGTSGWVPLLTNEEGQVTGIDVAPVANSDVVGGIPVCHVFDIADAASADYDIVLTDKTEVYEVTIVKTSGTGTTVTATVKNGSTAITDAMSLSGAIVGAVVHCASIDPASGHNVVDAAGTLRVSIARTAGDAGCRVFVRGVKRA